MPTDKAPEISERESLKVAEASRQAEWAKPSFMRGLFLGNFRLDLIHPYPLPGGSTANVTMVNVQVTYTHNFIMLGPVIALINGNWGNSMNLVTQSRMRLEAGAAGAGS
jgi:hypothetical protein